MNRNDLRSRSLIKSPNMAGILLAINLMVQGLPLAYAEVIEVDRQGQITVAATKKGKSRAVRRQAKPAVDAAQLKSTTESLKKDFNKIQNDLQNRQSKFMNDMRRNKSKPADGNTLDRLFQNRIKDAAKLDSRWTSAHQKAGRKNTKSPGWERTISRQHQRWLRAAMTTGESSKAGRNAHLTALAIMKSVVGRLDNEASVASYRPRIARLLQLSGKHADAVRAYLELADANDTTSPVKKIQYLKAASVSQAVLADWPLTTPWFDVASGRMKNRSSNSQEELKDILGRIATGTGGVDNVDNWKYDAQIGLIDWVSGQIETALALWQPRLNSQVPLRGNAMRDRNQAGGFTLQHYKTTKQWAELEKTSRQSLSLRWKPAFGKKSISASAMLGDALFEGGKGLLESGDAKSAVIKLTEFTRNYRKDSRFEEAFFLRGKAEQAAGQYIDALQTFKDFTTRFQRSRFDAEANRIGFKLATDMAEEDAGLYFGKRYSIRHRSSPDHTAITESYAALAIGTGNYDEGISALEQLAAKKSGAEARVEALARILDIQTLIAPPESVLATAARLMRNRSLPAEIQLRVYRAQARAAVITGDDKLIAQTRDKTAKLWNASGLSSDSPQEQRDAIGEIYFLYAESIGKTETDPVFGLEVRDPDSHAKKMDARFRALKAPYDAVCEIGRNLHCAAALFQTARLAERFKSAIAELNIAETLDESKVEGFKATKSDLERKWKEDTRRSDAQARELAGQGMVAPGYALAIQLGNGADLILDDRTIGGLHGFIQIDGR